MPTLVFEQTPACIIAIFGGQAITDREWDAYLAAIEESTRRAAAARALVITGNVAPSPAQRRRLDAAIHSVREQLKVAIVTNSTFVRGVVSAFAIFVRGYRAFDEDALDEALAYLDVRGHHADEVRAAVIRLRARIDIG